MTREALEEALQDLRSEALEILRDGLGFEHMFACIETVLASREHKKAIWRVTIALTDGRYYVLEDQIRLAVIQMLRDELDDIKQDLKAMVS